MFLTTTTPSDTGQRNGIWQGSDRAMQANNWCIDLFTCRQASVQHQHLNVTRLKRYQHLNNDTYTTKYVYTCTISPRIAEQTAILHEW